MKIRFQDRIALAFIAAWLGALPVRLGAALAAFFAWLFSPLDLALERRCVMYAGPAQPNMQQLMQQNNAIRQALLATAPKLSKHIGTFNGFNVGNTARIRLQNVGVLTRLRLRIQCPVTIGTAIATPSAKAPYNLINRVKVTDYDGTDRVNISGHHLWVVNSVRARMPFDRNNEAMTAVLSQPVTPTAIGNGTIDFFIEIPIAYNRENDLRGAFVSQTAVGDAYVSIDFNPTLYANGNGDAVYNGAATTTVAQQAATSITVDVWQDYMLPQALDAAGNVPMPPLDLRTVYELAGMVTDSTNLAQNQQKLIQYPNLRTVYGAYFSYVTNSNLAAVGQVGAIQLIANANNILWDEIELTQYFKQRQWIRGDLLQGVFFFLHRDLPIQTALYGNIQAGFTPAAAPVATDYIEYTWEDFYSKGMALPGIPQGG